VAVLGVIGECLVGNERKGKVGKSMKYFAKVRGSGVRGKVVTGRQEPTWSKLMSISTKDLIVDPVL
jgi:hypothetical protein